MYCTLGYISFPFVIFTSMSVMMFIVVLCCVVVLIPCTLLYIFGGLKIEGFIGRFGDENKIRETGDQVAIDGYS